MCASRHQKIRYCSYIGATTVTIGILLIALISNSLVCAWVSKEVASTRRSNTAFTSGMKASSAQLSTSGGSGGSPIASGNHPHPRNMNPLPNISPLPPAICSDVPDTWAYDTMSRRVNEDILALTVADCAADLDKPEFAHIEASIDALRNELSHAATTKLTPLDKPKLPPTEPRTKTTTDDANDDPTINISNYEERIKEWNEWNAILTPLIEHEDTWLTAPWMVTEFYVYRRLMQCFDYWNKDSAGYKYDPFYRQKRNGLVSSVGNAEPALRKLQHLVATLPNFNINANSISTSSSSTSESSIRTGLTLATQLALWGNKMDLSLWPADVGAADTDVFSGILEAAVTNLLHDDSAVLADYCCHTLLLAKSGTKRTRVDIIVDNAGFELVTDLALAQYLIESGIADVVTFQLKSHPTFVSDALEKDLLETVNYYADSLDADKYPACTRAGNKWRELLCSGQWKCVEDNFWVQPFAMWDMTEPLRSELATNCDLAFVKGDANYRRLLGDRTWDLDAPFADVVGCYFPVPVCALRTLKAEIGCGMDRDQIERAAALDDNWMTNGRFGVVQFGKGATR